MKRVCKNNGCPTRGITVDVPKGTDCISCGKPLDVSPEAIADLLGSDIFGSEYRG